MKNLGTLLRLLNNNSVEKEAKNLRLILQISIFRLR